jgi:hypothetical protein
MIAAAALTTVLQIWWFLDVYADQLLAGNSLRHE